jgi:hypothetical protein
MVRQRRPMLLRSSVGVGLAIGGATVAGPAVAGAPVGLAGLVGGGLSSPARGLVGTREEGSADGTSFAIVGGASGVVVALAIVVALATGGRSFRPGGNVIEPPGGGVREALARFA